MRDILEANQNSLKSSRDADSKNCSSKALKRSSFTNYEGSGKFHHISTEEKASKFIELQKFDGKSTNYPIIFPKTQYYFKKINHRQY